MNTYQNALELLEKAEKKMYDNRMFGESELTVKENTAKKELLQLCASIAETFYF